MYYDKIKESAKYIKEIIKDEPQIGAILGSGLGAVADEIEDAIAIKYDDIPNMPVSTVEGHAGQFVFGTMKGKKVIMMQGRFHYYEGYDMKDVVLPVHIMRELGVESILVTNAAGGVNESFKPGDLMIIDDHINLAGDNPLMGKNIDEFGPRFPDMSCAYNKELRAIAKEQADKLNIDIKNGVYAMMSGPTYETPAEIRMVRVIGGDAVGMSTVPEVTAANHSGVKVLGISCITNMAAGILDQPLNHEEVMETSAMARESFIALVMNVIEAM